MIDGLTAIEFERDVQKRNVRVSLPTEAARAFGIKASGRARLAISGPTGVMPLRDVRLTSGRECRGPELRRIARKGDRVRIRLEPHSASGP